MKKWEYQVINISGNQSEDIQELLEEVGSIGWELVAVSNNRLYLKRPV